MRFAELAANLLRENGHDYVKETAIRLTDIPQTLTYAGVDLYGPQQATMLRYANKGYLK